MSSELMSTGLVPDSDLEDTDNYGNVWLRSFVDEDESDENDASEGEAQVGAKGKDDEEEEAPPLVAPSTRQIMVEPGDDQDDDPAAYEALTSYDGGGLSPGEAQRLIDYMRPLSEEEEEMADNPMFNDLTIVDDAANTDDMLKHVKGTSRAMTKYMQDESYGDMGSEEELAELNDSFVPRSLPSGTNQALFNPRTAKYEIVAFVDEPKISDVTNQALGDVRKAKYTILSGLSKTLVEEHAAWLEEQDRKVGIKLRPHSYYVDVSKLWAKDKLKRAALPTSMNGDFSGSLGAFVGTAHELIRQTADKRLRNDSLGWSWNPIKQAKSWAKTSYNITKRSITDPLKYGYKFTKKGIQLTKKGLYAGLSLAQRAALAPIKAVIQRFTNKIVNKRAGYYAKQAGVKTPTPAMRKQAHAWSKSYVRKHLPGYGRIISSLMGDDGPGSYYVDLSLGEIDHAIATSMGADITLVLGNDIMGFGIGDIGRLIGLGVTGIFGMLNSLMRGLFGVKGGGKAPVDQPDGSPEGASPEAAEDPGAGDPGEGAEAAAPDEAAPEDAAQGWDRSQSKSQIRKTITLEQISGLPNWQRAKVQQALRQGRIRLV